MMNGPMTQPDIRSADLQAMMDAATDGPWGSSRYTTQAVDGPDQRGICSTGGFSASWIDSEVLLLENEANARLIASAPDLAAEVIRLRAANIALVAGQARLHAALVEIRDTKANVTRHFSGPSPEDELDATVLEMDYEYLQAIASNALSQRGQDHAG